ncbi:MAG: SUMF1/EgtB/PvdO family nonheme iron enzyme [Planctomycetia bacterium]|nr:SUMF1/EgtB/PvdO family nonheme iron enzyme [Planctomycetia bacterium]
MARSLPPADRRAAQIALRLGLVSQEQVDEAVARMEWEPDRDLPAILFTRGAVTAEQAGALREFARELESGSATQEVQRATVPLGAGASAAWVHPAGEVPSARYSLKDEIGRGGLGRVVEAVDHVFHRTVALKLLVEDADPVLLDRFRFEALITGRLDHPHIVAVHDMGVLAGTRDAFFAMKRIQGEDLAKIIIRRSWPQRRLIEALRDVCLAVAYAHSRGVVHRDLKPANVMLGDYGEVFVVDWGLARSLHFEAPGEATAPGAAEIPGAGPDTPRLTMAGTIIGTPQYMSPEQARGEIDAVDERSDVYGLGAILYQILTGHPPFEGEDARQVLARVEIERPTAPSKFEPVDPQLEAICLRALEKEPRARFASARAMANEVDAYLEGMRDLERRMDLAARHLEEAKRLTRDWKGALDEWRAVRLEREQSRESLRKRQGIDALRAGWHIEDRLDALARRGLELFHEADVKIGAALSVVPGHEEARRMRAANAWEKFLLAEEEGDERGMLGARQALEAADDGTWMPQVRGHGELTVETFAYRCTCLRSGRRVEDGPFPVCGIDAWTGACTPGAGPGRPRFLKVHSTACPRAPVPGAEVWMHRHLEADRILVPVGEGIGGSGVPEVALRRLFEGSAFAPQGPGVLLGRTPLRGVRVPMGPGLLVVVAPGFDPVAVPFSVDRGERVETALTLFTAGERPDSARLVTAPPRRSGALRPGRRTEREAGIDGEFFVERLPVTCRDYAAFLNAVAAGAPREALRHAPRGAESSDWYWLEDARGQYAVPTATGEGAGMADAWREDWPVVGVSWEDAMAYARWRTEREGRLWSLLPERLWQRAAQGEDGRAFPWGDRRIAWFSHNLESAEGRQHPEPVGSRPCDESPFGIRDMAGNVSQWCLDEVPEAGAGLKFARGGNWSASHLSIDCTTRLVGRADLVHPTIGFRLCSPVAVAAPTA